MFMHSSCELSCYKMAMELTGSNAQVELLIRGVCPESLRYTCRYPSLQVCDVELS